MDICNNVLQIKQSTLLTTMVKLLLNCLKIANFETVNCVKQTNTTLEQEGTIA